MPENTRFFVLDLIESSGRSETFSDVGLGVPAVWDASSSCFLDKLSFPAECGWSEEDNAEMGQQTLTATLTATSYSEGDWQKSLHILLPAAGVDFKLYYTVGSEVLAIRKVEGWSQQERCAKSASSCNSGSGLIASDASGTRGDVISVDLKTGELRAEVTDNYWGRRARALIKGSLDAATGKFQSVEAISFLNASVYVNTTEGVRYVSGKFASARGTVADGIVYNGGQIGCGSGSCALDDLASATLNGPGPECSVSGGCAGNSGYAFDFTDKNVEDFVFLGADFDSSGGSRSQNESYLKAATLPKFTEVSFSAAVE